MSILKSLFGKSQEKNNDAVTPSKITFTLDPKGKDASALRASVEAYIQMEGFHYLDITVTGVFSFIVRSQMGGGSDLYLVDCRYGPDQTYILSIDRRTDHPKVNQMINNWKKTIPAIYTIINEDYKLPEEQLNKEIGKVINLDWTNVKKTGTLYRPLDFYLELLGKTPQSYPLAKPILNKTFRLLRFPNSCAIWLDENKVVRIDMRRQSAGVVFAGVDTATDMREGIKKLYKEFNAQGSTEGYWFLFPAGLISFEIKNIKYNIGCICQFSDTTPFQLEMLSIGDSLITSLPKTMVDDARVKGRITESLPV